MTQAERRQRHYDLMTEQASLDESGGLSRERAILLLWFLRNYVGLGDMDAYDHISDGDQDNGIDGLHLDPSEDGPDTLYIYSSKYTETPTAQVGDTDIDRLAGAAIHFQSAESLQRLLGGAVEDSLRTLIGKLGIEARLNEEEEALQIRLRLVTTGTLSPAAQRKVESLRAAHGTDYIRVWDIDTLGELAAAVASPERISESIEIPITDASQLLITGVEPRRTAITPVQASRIAEWPGIESRMLFALNVRHELKSTKVRKALDSAIRKPEDHELFLAYHNGLTVICDRFTVHADRLVVDRPSVVNGAQSVLAFARGLADDALTDDLRVAVKVVEIEGRPTVAKEVSRRSNTQTAVNPRNLMANSGPQLRIAREFEALYPDITYATRPDSVDPGTPNVISNDDSAQLLCTIFNAMPWLAVKKLSLFESDNHAMIFGQDTTAHHVVLAMKIAEAVQENAGRFPDTYRTTWRLTKLVACYLVGQIARRAAEPGPSILEDPKAALADGELDATLTKWARIAASSLKLRYDNLQNEGHDDDFKKDFKNEGELKRLSAAAAQAYALSEDLARES